MLRVAQFSENSKVCFVKMTQTWPRSETGTCQDNELKFLACSYAMNVKL